MACEKSGKSRSSNTNLDPEIQSYNLCDTDERFAFGKYFEEAISVMVNWSVSFMTNGMNLVIGSLMIFKIRIEVELMRTLDNLSKNSFSPVIR